MNKFKTIGISIPKFLLGTSNSGILLGEYKGPQYYDMLELMKREDPLAYNRLLIEEAKSKSPNSEIIRYKDSKGIYKTASNVGAGYVSETDPVGKFVTETVTLSKPMLWAGKGILYVGLNLPGILKLLTHPTWKKIYHGTNKDFTWETAIPYSTNNVGLHISPNKKIAESFSRRTNGRIMEGYAPKPKVETIDLGYNNYNLLNKSYKFSARPRNSNNYYNVVLPDSKRIEMLKKAGAEPSVNVQSRSRIHGDIYKLNTEKDVNLDLRKNLRLSKTALKKADYIISRAKSNFPNKDEVLNKETAELLSKDGIRTIKYNNISNSEGMGGESWIITDSSIVWNPTWKPLNFNPRLERLAPIIPFTHD